jgi:hypothetical protein
MVCARLTTLAKSAAAGQNYDICIDELEAMVAKWVRRYNTNLFEDSPVICAIRSFVHNKFSFHVDRYFKVTQKLVELGAELHCTSDTTDLSLLHRILAEAREPAEASRIFRFWILVLNEARIDMTRYFNIELDFHFQDLGLTEDQELGLIRKLECLKTSLPRMYYDI